jgi:AraC-like DNA-binding protein
MTDARVAFGVGSRLVMDAVTWKVIELQGTRVTLSSDGRHRCVDIDVLANRDDVVIDGRPVGNVGREVEFVQLDKVQKAAFERLHADHREWETGYRSGSVLAAGPGEPRDENPGRRAELIAADRGVAVGTLYRKFRELESEGPRVVVDRRRQRKREEEPSFDARFLTIAERMLVENRERSTVKRHSFYIDVCAEVRNVHAGKDPVPEPSQETFLTWLSLDSPADRAGLSGV